MLNNTPEKFKAIISPSKAVRRLSGAFPTEISAQATSTPLPSSQQGLSQKTSEEQNNLPSTSCQQEPVVAQVLKVQEQQTPSTSYDLHSMLRNAIKEIKQGCKYITLIRTTLN